MIQEHKKKIQKYTAKNPMPPTRKKESSPNFCPYKVHSFAQFVEPQSQGTSFSVFLLFVQATTKITLECIVKIRLAAMTAIQ